MISTVTRGPAAKIAISANITPNLMGPTPKDCLRCTEHFRLISTVTRGPTWKIAISANITPNLMGPMPKDCLRCTDHYRMISTVTRGPTGKIAISANLALSFPITIVRYCHHKGFFRSTHFLCARRAHKKCFTPLA